MGKGLELGLGDDGDKGVRCIYFRKFHLETESKVICQS